LTVQIDPGFLRQPLFADDRQAVAVLSIAIATQPACGEAYLHRGMAYGRLKTPASAIADYQNFLMRVPTNDSRRPEVNLRIAANYESLGDTKHVLETLAQVVDSPLELIPSPGSFAKLCNDAVWEQVKPSNASITPLIIKLLDRALEITPLNSDYLNTYGVAMYRMGRFAEAVRFLEKGLELRQRPDPFDLFFLAMCHARLGQRDQALACFEHATNMAQAEPNIAKNLLAELKAFRAEAEQSLGVVSAK
jgi:tetratricopeptide (TPR) repeat protein